jgi:stage II sporulation protein D
MYNDKLVKTPYFNATDGTYTKSAEEVWGWTNTPYLVSVPDNLCKSTEFKGHGVGLSGCGATEASKLGKTYKEILKYYYTGIEIKKAY